MVDVIAAGVTPESRRHMFETFREHNVGLYTGAKVGQFFPDGVDHALADGTPGSLRGFDSIVLAMGARSNAPSRRWRKPSARRCSSSARRRKPPATPSPPRPTH
ncbi:MAG: hypothetical protein MSC56_04400 [Clostridiales bacterium]|nr:hypothetical protein [Clostridiales bacterium]